MKSNEEKPKGLADGEIKAENEDCRRFLAVSEHFMMLRVCVLAALIAFIFAVLIFGHGSLRAENFKYLVKYIDKSPVLYSSFYEGIEYEGGENMKFGLYKGDVCVFGEGSVSLYGISGKNTFYSDVGIANASVYIGKEHLCVYGGDKNELKIYNSFSLVHSMSFDYPILCVTAADAGGFAVATSERGYRSAVYVYNKAFIHKYTWKSADKFVLDTDLGESGRYLALLSMGTENGSPYTEALFIDTESGEVIFSRKISGKTPVGVNITKKDGACFVFSDSYLCIDKKGNVKSEGKTGEGTYGIYRGVSDTAIVSRAEGSMKSEIFIAEKGIKISSGGKIKSVKFYGDRIYLLFEGRVEIYDGENLYKSFDISGDARDILIMDDGTAIVCYGSYTVLISDIT